MSQYPHQRITIVTVSGNEYSVVVDHRSGRALPRMYENEGYKLIHFGRTMNGVWTEIKTFPVEQVEWYG